MKLTIEKGSLRVDINPEELELEAVCPLCSFGFHPSGAKCSCCEGTGMIVTPLGEKILSFVCRNAAAWRKDNKPNV